MLLDDQKERLLSETKSQIVKHECRIELADNSIRELNRQIETQRVDFDHTTTGYSQSRRELSKNWQYEKGHIVKLVLEVLMEWKNCRVFKNYESMSFREEDWLKTKKLLMLTARTQELQNDLNCTNDSRDFQDVESLRSGKFSHVPSQPASFPQNPGGELGGMMSRDQSLRPDTWNPHKVSGNVFAGLFASASTP